MDSKDVTDTEMVEDDFKLAEETLMQFFKKMVSPDVHVTERFEEAFNRYGLDFANKVHLACKERCNNEGRQRITSEDILKVLKDLHFNEDLIEEVEAVYEKDKKDKLKAEQVRKLISELKITKEVGKSKCELR